jgi:hypothetical protein
MIAVELFSVWPPLSIIFAAAITAVGCVNSMLFSVETKGQFLDDQEGLNNEM